MLATTWWRRAGATGSASPLEQAETGINAKALGPRPHHQVSRRAPPPAPAPPGEAATVSVRAPRPGPHLQHRLRPLAGFRRRPRLLPQHGRIVSHCGRSAAWLGGPRKVMAAGGQQPPECACRSRPIDPTHQRTASARRWQGTKGEHTRGSRFVALWMARQPAGQARASRARLRGLQGRHNPQPWHATPRPLNLHQPAGVPGLANHQNRVHPQRQGQRRATAASAAAQQGAGRAGWPTGRGIRADSSDCLPRGFLGGGGGPPSPHRNGLTLFLEFPFLWFIPLPWPPCWVRWSLGLCC